jgi:predicted neuraminidase
MPCRIASLALLWVLGLLTLQSEDWKLKELEYNQPGMSVDLGVGLWAWPMPMDYDQDGDLDLVVACPDKPSNGVYFFENPGLAPGQSLPIFRKAIRVGDASQNMQVSYVAGQARVLVENQECLDFRNQGFASRATIYPEARFHPGQTRARMWRYVDWEGDGDLDLMVGVGDWSDYIWDQAYDAQGRWQHGPLHGWVYLIENQDGVYAKNPVKVTAGGSPVDVYGWPSPNLADFDGDGDLDLLCGEFLDGFTYFENIGSRQSPSYASGRRLMNSAGESLKMDLQMITPVAIDWDGDGDMDLVVGDEDGRVALVEHLGRVSGGMPEFRAPVYFQQEADTLKFGALATPFAHDWDGDGDEDILCGNTAGQIGIFINLDGNGKQWSAPSLLEVDGKPFRITAGEDGSIQGPAEAKWGYTTFSVADWDGDGHEDVIVNSILARLMLLKNRYGRFESQPLPFWRRSRPPTFYWWDTLAEETQTQWRTTPFACDFDGDDLMDLILLDQEGYLTCQSRALKDPRHFVNEDEEPIRLNARTAGGSGRIKLDVVDWDGDGRLDILVNSENATWYRNCETRSGKIVLKRIGPLARRNVAGHTSSPSTCDFDRDGRPDLLIGAENGRIYYIAHQDCIAYPKASLQARGPQAKQAPPFAGWRDASFIYDQAPFPECHASTIAQTSRGLVAAWFGGTREKHPDVGIWSSYHDGEGWSTPRQWADGVQHADLRYPTWNPVLYQPPGKQPLMLFFKVGPNPQQWWGEVLFSYDGGRSFRDRRRLPEGMDGPVRCKPLLLPSGVLLCPSSTEHGNDWRFHFERLSNLSHPELGSSWSRHEPEEQPFQIIQPTFLSHPDGSLQALCRSKHERIVQSFSRDGGLTWSPLERTDMPNNNSGIESLSLSDGRHLLVYNHMGGGRRQEGWGFRNRIHLAMSEDGRSWQAVAELESAETGEFSYPSMIQASDGLVHITYTWNRQRVRHMILDPAALEPIGPVSRFDAP